MTALLHLKRTTLAKEQIILLASPHANNQIGQRTGVKVIARVANKGEMARRIERYYTITTAAAASRNNNNNNNNNNNTTVSISTTATVSTTISQFYTNILTIIDKEQVAIKFENVIFL